MYQECIKNLNRSRKSWGIPPPPPTISATKAFLKVSDDDIQVTFLLGYLLRYCEQGNKHILLDILWFVTGTSTPSSSVKAWEHFYSIQTSSILSWHTFCIHSLLRVTSHEHTLKDLPPPPPQTQSMEPPPPPSPPPIASPP
jgi:hypothetical protein